MPHSYKPRRSRVSTSLPLSDSSCFSPLELTSSGTVGLWGTVEVSKTSKKVAKKVGNGQRLCSPPLSHSGRQTSSRAHQSLRQPSRECRLSPSTHGPWDF